MTSPRPGAPQPLIFIKGFLIGIANIIPGVSGGTFALILGVFDRIVHALNAVGRETLTAALAFARSPFGAAGRRALAAEWRRLDMTFLLVLGAGALAAILSGSFAIDYLLRYQHAPTLAFFIGLILPSIAIPYGMMEPERRLASLVFAIPGVLSTVGVSLVMPEETAGSDSLIVAVGIGALGVSAMILPGLSGSYVLLVLGQYQNVLEKLTGVQHALAAGKLDLPAIVWLLAFSLGMAAGILAFARLLEFLLARHRNATMAFLIGLLVGSLYVLWPFKDIDDGARILDRGGDVKVEIKIATAPNRAPRSLEEAAMPAVALLGGLVGSAGLIALGKKRDDAGR